MRRRRRRGAGPPAAGPSGGRLRLFSKALLAARLAAVQSGAISALKLHGPMRSLKEVIRENKGANQMPEMMCFGLLESFDLPQIEALIAPRPVLVE